MSRGPGKLQQRILITLATGPGGRMWWPRLKERYPEEVRTKTFYRAIRSLKRMDLIEVQNDNGLRYLRMKPEPQPVDDKELNALLAALPERRYDAAMSKARRLQEVINAGIKLR